MNNLSISNSILKMKTNNERVTKQELEKIKSRLIQLERLLNFPIDVHTQHTTLVPRPHEALEASKLLTDTIKEIDKYILLRGLPL